MDLSEAIAAFRAHRPYEGQQHRLHDDGQRLRRDVLIAPTRGSNLIISNTIELLGGVLIAPTRGSNPG